MKNYRFFAQMGSIFLIALAISGSIYAFGQPVDLYPNYVVIGAFAKHKNAINFTNHASDLSLSAKYEINPNRNLYYVYVLTTPDRAKAIEEARRLRKETEFFDTWVFNGLLGKDAPASAKGQDINPVTEQQIVKVPSSDIAVSQEVSEANSVTSENIQANAVADSSKISAPSNEISPSLDDDLDGKSFLFKLYRASDSTTVEGDVDVIDTEKSKKIGTYKGNIPVRISKPSGKSGQVSYVCEVFGYRKLQRDLDFSSPQSDDIKIDENGNTVIPFELVRLRKGDIAIMYNVYFFKDAGIMRPESRFEVNSLMQMLNENPKYKIKIHGHTNGNAAGKIISMGSSNSFFALTDTKEGYGSAKKLSEERANVIKEYLISEGIHAHRMHVKSWGGKRPIHDKMSNRAQENVRVEIEILEDK